VRNNILKEVADLVSPLIPFQDAESRISREDGWISRLTQEDLGVLLDWLEHPKPIDAPIPVESTHLPEVTDRVAYYDGKAGRRLNSQGVRRRLECLLSRRELRMSALEGLDAFGDRNAVGAIRTVIKDTNASIIRQVAFVLGSLGGGEAVVVLEAMLTDWSNDPVVRKTIEGAIKEAVDH
jgi:hypothetical protein